MQAAIAAVVGTSWVLSSWVGGAVAGLLPRDTGHAVDPLLQLAQVEARIEAASETLLRFETRHYLVRVFRQQERLFLNVYNKETGITDQNRVPATIAPPRSGDDDWRTYVNQEGDLHYLARVNPEGQTELEIRLAGGPPAQPEPGFNVTYSFPHTYLGQNLDGVLTDLETAGWGVDTTSPDSVSLLGQRQGLILRFDPRTRVITHTRLIDL